MCNRFMPIVVVESVFEIRGESNCEVGTMYLIRCEPEPSR